MLEPYRSASSQKETSKEYPGHPQGSIPDIQIGILPFKKNRRPAQGRGGGGAGSVQGAVCPGGIEQPIVVRHRQRKRFFVQRPVESEVHSRLDTARSSHLEAERFAAFGGPQRHIHATGIQAETESLLSLNHGCLFQQFGLPLKRANFGQPVEVVGFLDRISLGQGHQRRPFLWVKELQHHRLTRVDYIAEAAARIQAYPVPIIDANGHFDDRVPADAGGHLRGQRFEVAEVALDFGKGERTAGPRRPQQRRQQHGGDSGRRPAPAPARHAVPWIGSRPVKTRDQFALGTVGMRSLGVLFDNGVDVFPQRLGTCLFDSLAVHERVSWARDSMAAMRSRIALTARFSVTLTAFEDIESSSAISASSSPSNTRRAKHSAWRLGMRPRTRRRLCARYWSSSAAPGWGSGETLLANLGPVRRCQRWDRRSSSIAARVDMAHK